MTDNERCRLGMIPEAMPMILILSTSADLLSPLVVEHRRSIGLGIGPEVTSRDRTSSAGSTGGRPKGPTHGAASRGGSTLLYVLHGTTVGDKFGFARCHPPG